MKPAKVEFESPSPHYDYQLLVKKLANTLPIIFHYRKPEVKRTGAKIYIEYYYRIPVDKRAFYKNKEWLRFRERFDINRRKSDKEVYAEVLRNELENRLKHGFNPFNTETINNFLEEQALPEVKQLNATDAMLLFLDAWNNKGLEPTSLQKYKKVVGRFIQWLALKKIPYTEISKITQDHIEKFLTDMQKQHAFSNREFNNHYDFLRTAFNFLVNKKHIIESPCKGIKKLKSKSTKHRYYDEKSLKDITRALEIKDPYTLFAFYTVYYLCVRSDKELMNLKVGNIKWEESKLLIDVGKGGYEDYVPMDENIKALFKEKGIDKYPDNYYIFSIEGKPSLKPFGRGFFSKRFAKTRDAAGLSKEFTLYGAKPTRVVHLVMDRVPHADIMSLTRHRTVQAFYIYLRGLGLTADIKNINAVSRKI